MGRKTKRTFIKKTGRKRWKSAKTKTNRVSMAFVTSVTSITGRRDDVEKMEEAKIELGKKLYLIGGVSGAQLAAINEAISRCAGAVQEAVEYFVESLSDAFASNESIIELQALLDSYFENKENYDRTKQTFARCKSNINKNKFNNRQFNSQKSVRMVRDRLR